MAEDLGDRSEEPTPRKIAEAREKGQVAKSQDLSGAIDLIGGVVLLAVLGGWLVTELGGTMLRLLSDFGGPGAARLDSAAPLITLTVGQFVWALTPFMLAMLLIAYVSHVVQTGPLWTLQPMAPDLNKLNPITGLQRVFSADATIRTITNIAKLSFVFVVGALYLAANLPRVAGLAALTPGAGILQILIMAAELLAWLLAVLLFLGVGDFIIQRQRHLKKLRMTKQEVQDERRSMEGDPQVKARRMRMARQIALQRAGAAVPQADVVVTNPTHFSVALKYDPDAMPAPRVVAKGADWLALQIRQIAIAHSVPIVERAPLARALYAAVEVGREVPPEHYQAVAEVLAYVYRLENRAASLASPQQA